MPKINLHPRTITINMPVEVIVEDEQDETGMPMNGSGVSVLIVRVPSIKDAQKLLDEGAKCLAAI
jgi:hypothetical protein